MASIKYILRQNKDKTESIYLVVNYGRKKQYRFNTKIKLSHKKYWNEQSFTVKNLLGIKDTHKVNANLSNYVSELNKFISKAKEQNIQLNTDILKRELNYIVNEEERHQEETPPKMELLEFYEWFIEYYSKNPRPSSKKPLTKGTKRVYGNSLEILKTYAKSVGKLDFEDITIQFHSDFVTYLQNKDLSQNYIGGQIKNLKAVMNDAFDRDYHNNMSYKKASFTKFTEQVNHIYLSRDELKKIIETDLNDNQRLATARDLFLIGAFTGLRVCDYKMLTNDNIKTSKGIKYIDVKTQKTSTNVVIPLSPEVLDILDRNDGVPRKMSDQKINEYIKIVGEKAGIDQMVDIEKTIGGVTKTERIEKYKLISNHTGRRSFCTNTYLSGMPVHNIMAMTGHKTEKSFYTYIKMEPKENIENLANHDFFKSR